MTTATKSHDSLTCNLGPDGQPCTMCWWANEAGYVSRDELAPPPNFESAWATAPPEYRAYVEENHALYWYLRGMQDEQRITRLARRSLAREDVEEMGRFGYRKGAITMGEMSDYQKEQQVGEEFQNDPLQPTETVWVTSDGQRINVSDMTDSHLVNTIRFLRRQVSAAITDEISAGYSILETLQGEMAIDTVERDLRRLENADVDEYLEEETPTWPVLLAEARRRGLRI